MLVLHLAFIAFVLLGGLLALRWPRAAWIHGPALLWGVWIELAGWVCPLTPLENWLRRAGGAAGYTEGFVEHYLMPVVYPPDLTRELQIALGIGVGMINTGVYALVWRRSRKSGGP